MPPYRYDPYDPSQAAGSIGEMLARAGQPAAQAAQQIAAAQARAAEIGGQAWGHAAQQVGQIPQQIQQQQDQQLDHRLKQQEMQARTLSLQDTVEQRAQAKQQRTVSIVGRVFAGAKSADEAVAGIDDLIELGSIAPDVGAHIKQTVTSGEWGPVKQRYIDFAEQFTKPEILGKGAQKISGVTNQVLAENPEAPKPPTEVELALQANGGNPAAALDRLKPAPSPTEATLAVKAAGGDAGALKALNLMKGASYQSESFIVDGKSVKGLFDPKGGRYLYNGEDVSDRVKPIPPAAATASDGQANDVRDAVAGMKEGTNPPLLPGRASKEYTAMLAEAKRQGYDLAGAATDWMATQKHIATMNGSQQLRLNQSINALPEMLDKVDALASKWKAGRLPLLNKANLLIAKNGGYGREAASVANQLDAQIADVTADLGKVYMGGNSPTDHALGLAEKALRSDWDEKVLHDMTALARSNVKIRHNSINNTGVAGASENNPYAPKPAATTAPNAPAGWKYVPKPGGGWTAVEDK